MITTTDKTPISQKLPWAKNLNVLSLDGDVVGTVYVSGLSAWCWSKACIHSVANNYDYWRKCPQWKKCVDLSKCSKEDLEWIKRRAPEIYREAVSKVIAGKL